MEHEAGVADGWRAERMACPRTKREKTDLAGSSRRLSFRNLREDGRAVNLANLSQLAELAEEGTELFWAGRGHAKTVLTNDGSLFRLRFVKRSNETRPCLRPKPLEAIGPDSRRVGREEKHSPFSSNADRFGNQMGGVDPKRRDSVLYTNRGVELGVPEPQMDCVHECQVAVPMSGEIRPSGPKIPPSDIDSHRPSYVGSDLTEDTPVSTAKF